MPATAQFDSAAPIDVSFRVDSLTIVTVRAQFMEPDGVWVDFADWSNTDGSTSSATPVGPLADGSAIRAQFLYESGANDEEPLRAHLLLSQGGQQLPGGDVPVRGDAPAGAATVVVGLRGAADAARAITAGPLPVPAGGMRASVVDSKPAVPAPRLTVHRGAGERGRISIHIEQIDITLPLVVTLRIESGEP